MVPVNSVSIAEQRLGVPEQNVIEVINEIEAIEDRLLHCFNYLTFFNFLATMSDNFMDHLGGHERERIRKRMRSPEAYEKLRENVKGPEDLERELEKMDTMAELHFALESEPRMQEAAKKMVEKAMEQGMDQVVDHVSPEAKKSLESGKFTLAVSAHPKTHYDQVVIVPEGNVQEKIPVMQTLSDHIASTLMNPH